MSVRSTLRGTAQVVLVAAVGVSAGALAPRLWPEPAPEPSPPPAPRVVPNWTDYTTAGTRMGPAEAPLQIVEFSDFQCSWCATVRHDLNRLLAAYPGQVALLYRHVPSARDHSFAAAVASECAAAQGRFGAFHEALFAGQGAIGTEPWEVFGRRAGVADLARLRACIDAQETGARVKEDRRAAERLGVRGTPTFLFNGRLYVGAKAVEQMEPELRKALAGA